MTGVVVRASAKVNFCLRVLGRWPDGYHEVETVLHTIGLWDRLRLSPVPGAGRITLEVNTAEAPADDSNVCWRAARLLMERAGARGGVAIKLEKAIPAAAGLAGGSSDAAATLAGLAHMWKLGLEPAELEQLAAEIGADVAFFLRGGCCLAWSRGERLETLPPVAAWLVLVVPEARVLTAEAYAALPRGPAGRHGRSFTPAVQRVQQAIAEGRLEALAEALHNDFEIVRRPGIVQAAEAKAALIQAGCLGATLSGSGPAVFGIARDKEAAAEIALRLKDRWAWVAAVPTVPAGESLVIQDALEV